MVSVEPKSVRPDLQRVIARLPPGLADALPALLAECNDPDSALILFDRLLTATSPEVLRLLERHPALAHYALLVFGHSRYLGETLIQNPDLLQSFLRDQNLGRSFSREDFQESLARFRSRTLETDISLILARFKRREYVRILLRDVLKIAPLAESTAEISALADVLLEAGLREADRELQRRHGPPQHVDADGHLTPTPFAILSLGKLGGNELNYSSDVDLIYIFGDGAEPTSARISNREYFIHVAQRITDILSTVTREGPVFRIDLRLRPQGGEGELAISLGQALRYYANTAQDWELQALIKVRHSAGDLALARGFIAGVQPYVYREEVNFAAIKTALVAREKQKATHRPAGREHAGDSIDVKIDSGGIRDIEFLVQCLQRVYGGAEPWLRAGGTLFSLQKLHDKGHLTGKEFHELTSAYEFLRHLEHRLQLRDGQQTHRLPLSGPDLQIFERAMDSCLPREPYQEDFVDLMRRRMSAVAELYRRIIYQQQGRGEREAGAAEFQLGTMLEPNLADQSNRHILERLARDAPVLYEAAIRDDLSATARKNLFRFLTATLTSSERYAAVVRHSEQVLRALPLFDASEYLTSILARHPEEIATIAELPAARARIGSGHLFESPLIPGRSVDPVFAYLAGSGASHPEKLTLLRRHFRHRLFASGAKDITELRGVYQSLGETTSAAEDAIAAAVEISGAPSGLAVMALGRLGSGEFDALSDADLLFVSEDSADRERLTKTVSQIVQVLTAYTKEGMVFSVDTRLRPRGGEGELLTTPTQLARYGEHEAHSWEALTYTKLRFVAGSADLGERAATAVRSWFQRFAADSGFPRAVCEMRLRLEHSESPEKAFKTSAGAIYDIDFLCGFLLVSCGAVENNGNLRDRLWRCVAHGLLEKADAAVLDHAADLVRTADHIARLAVGRVCRWLPLTEHARRVTEKLTSQILRRNFSSGLEAELEQNCLEVRRIYDRVLKAQP